MEKNGNRVNWNTVSQWAIFLMLVGFGLVKYIANDVSADVKELSQRVTNIERVEIDIAEIKTEIKNINKKLDK